SSGSCALGAPIVCDLGNMASGSSITVNVVVTTTVAGTVVSTASVTADQTDTDLVNNSDVENTVVTLPDLLAPVLNAAAAVIPGDALVITDTTKNNGSLSAAPSTTKFYLSTDNKFDAGGDVELGSRPIPELAAKQASTGSTTVTIPLGTPLGNYFLIAVADADNMIAETKDTNKKTRKLSVTRPDLTISRLQSPSSAAAGSSLVVKETTSNKAAVSAEGSTTKFYLSADAILDGSDVLLGSRDVAALSPKSNSAASTMVDIPLTTLSGKYYLIAVCDSTDAVVEVNEGNNTRSKKITITP
ncbi:MAG TPA: CARDB domain-containing protein, partial [Candidatus Binatia bacterium]